ncbi:hypothetical protein APR04_003925 [Promicromonospora umidemergens]|uniref:DUF2087 domain-containing protein n=1 Tax=Promicromonospora umidemergens TaxID=629679 RepID=A0ABP8X4Z0_9MICO|nr:hypothetical protein [Promicromonospora umidemergens]MCP2284998.1 hypothetical protein [Promicromonospora umidemergens]
MGTFDWHHEINELEPLRGPDGLAAFGLFVRAGSWTSKAGQTGFVTDEGLAELRVNVEAMAADIDRLVEAGLWKRAEGGYRMLRGPHSDPNLPMPLWRYSEGDTGGRLAVVEKDSDA